MTVGNSFSHIKRDMGEIMMDRIDKKLQIIIDEKELDDLSREFSKIFIAADYETSGNMYSGEHIKLKFPKIWELYCLTCRL